MNANVQIPTLNKEHEQPDSTAARIRARLLAAGQRFHANDNISAFLEPGEREAICKEVEHHVRKTLYALVIDVDHDHNSQDTARRIASMYINELFSGRYEAPPAMTRFPNANALGELQIIGPIAVRSTCSHHLCPIIGQVWIGLLPQPDSTLIGLSKYARLTRWIMRRPQIQEEAVVHLADELEQQLNPTGLAVLMRAQHYCMHWRGVRDENAMMTNTVMRGALLEDATLRHEFLTLIGS